MSAELGKATRLRRLLGADGRAMIVALDQAIARGPEGGLATIGRTLDAVASAAPDAIVLHKGIARGPFAAHAGRVPLILKCSAFSLPYHATYDAIVATVDEALACAADGVSIGISVGSGQQVAQLENLGRLAERAAAAGMPLICHAYPSGELIDADSRVTVENVRYASRLAAELGADIIKTWYTGSPESFREVVEATPAAVMVAGGAAVPEHELMKLIDGVIEAGGRGVALGRNVWSAPDPAALVRRLHRAVHG